MFEVNVADSCRRKNHEYSASFAFFFEKIRERKILLSAQVLIVRLVEHDLVAFDETQRFTSSNPPMLDRSCGVTGEYTSLCLMIQDKQRIPDLA